MSYVYEFSPTRRRIVLSAPSPRGLRHEICVPVEPALYDAYSAAHAQHEEALIAALQHALRQALATLPSAEDAGETPGDGAAEGMESPAAALVDVTASKAPSSP